LSDPTNRDRDDIPPDGPRRATNEGTDVQTLQLLAEDLSVAKETLETGRARISMHTHEREALINENLAYERVEIEIVPAGMRVNAIPEVRQEGDVTIFPVVEEVLVVERQLVLKEEVRIKRVRGTERHQERVTLRRQEAIVTRDQPNGSKADPKSSG
jgi:uncharacterized protein (TIGR02271 family)